VSGIAGESQYRANSNEQAVEDRKRCKQAEQEAKAKRVGPWRDPRAVSCRSNAAVPLFLYGIGTGEKVSQLVDVV